MADENPPIPWLNGQLQLRQPQQGHRAGTDAILLAAAVAKVQGRIVDVGAGVGCVGLALALRAPLAQVALVEKNIAAAAMARENIGLNGFSQRMSVHEADVLRPASRRASGLGDRLADIVVSNPPFYQAGRHRASGIADQAAAHMLQPGDLGRWIAACLALAAPGGWLYMIHRPEALAEILAAGTGRMGAVTLCPIYSRAGEPAHRLLLCGQRGSRAPLRMCQGIALHESGGGFTPLASALHRGEALIDWC